MVDSPPEFDAGLKGLPGLGDGSSVPSVIAFRALSRDADLGMRNL
jgi:hypothetical protein